MSRLCGPRNAWFARATTRPSASSYQPTTFRAYGVGAVGVAPVARVLRVLGGDVVELAVRHPRRRAVDGLRRAVGGEERAARPRRVERSRTEPVVGDPRESLRAAERETVAGP